jgi:hypothetical protein
VVHPVVLTETLAVIPGHHNRQPFPVRVLAQTGEDPFELVIEVADLAVIEVDGLLNRRIIPARNLSLAQKNLQILVCLEPLAKPRWWIVRIVRIKEMDPEKEGLGTPGLKPLEDTPDGPMRVCDFRGAALMIAAV